ncbi:MAG: hypothetical protein ABW208_27600 [Pyrinomonadaceae bacterium]
MKKCVTFRRLAFANVAFALLLSYPVNGQKTILRQTGTVKPEETSSAKAADARKKGERESPAQKALHGPVILPQPGSETLAASSPGVARDGKTQAGAAKEQPPAAAANCDWTLLVLNEVGAFHLFSSGIPCLGCRISSDLSQSDAGVLGFSKNPTGPWTETLTIFTDINFAGNGTSETFYLKGVSAGASTVHAQNFWSQTSVPFRVEPCACPEIPTVP